MRKDARIRYQQKLAKPPLKLRPYNPQFRAAPPPDNPEFHQLQVAIALVAEDESPHQADKLIRDAAFDAAGADDLRRAERIADIARGTRVKIGPKIGCEILAALGRFLDDVSD